MIPHPYVTKMAEGTIFKQDHSQRDPRQSVAAKIATDEGIAKDGYRLMINCKAHGGQEVYHIHRHVPGGRPLGQMLARSE